MTITDPQYDSEPALIDVQIQSIQEDLNHIKDELKFIRETIVKADTTITTVGEQVMPTLNGLMNSPMLKMLIPKDKK